MPRCGEGTLSESVTYTTVLEAPKRSTIFIVPLGWWWRSPQRSARGPSSGQVWLVSMFWCGEGSKSFRLFHMRVLMFGGLPVW